MEFDSFCFIASQKTTNIQYAVALKFEEVCSVKWQGNKAYIIVIIIMRQKAYCQILLLACMLMLTDSSLQGCTVATPQGICYACHNRYYLVGKQCNLVNPLCNTYNSTNGQCLSCFKGYILNNQLCVKDSPIDPYCAKQTGTICLSCIPGYVFNSNNKCQNTCATFNPLNGYCNTCITGYAISKGKCLSKGGVNLACSRLVDGFCTNCYPGNYINTIGACILANPLCKTFALNGGLCLSCYTRYYVSSGSCVQVNPQCLTYDVKTGSCLSCYQGYKLMGVNCIIPK